MVLKKIIIFLTIIILLFLFVKKPNVESPKNTTIGVANNNDSKILEDLTFGRNVIVVENVTNYKLDILENFDTNLTSGEINEKYNCKLLINGAMFNKSRKPIGLFYLNGKYYEKVNRVDFMDGVVVVDKSGKIGIEKLDNYKFNTDQLLAMQSGPLLLYKGSFETKDNLKNYGRRIMLGVDDKNEVYVIAIFDRGDFNTGPQYSEIKNILNFIKERRGITLQSVINLDGGDASLFINEKFSVKETTLAGSYFCFS